MAGLFTHAYPIRAGVDGHRLWTVTRGFGFHRDRYRMALLKADLLRQGDSMGGETSLLASRNRAPSIQPAYAEGIGGHMLARWLQPRTEIAYTLLRVVAGILFSIHGFQKLFGVLGGHLVPAFSQLWIGAIIEIVCGLAIAAGALTAWAAFLAAGTMAVAYVQFHWKFQLGEAFFPAVNQGEPALLYSVAFLFIACRGGGRWSVDGLRTAPRPSGLGRSETQPPSGLPRTA